MDIRSRLKSYKWAAPIFFSSELINNQLANQFQPCEKGAVNAPYASSRYAL